MALLFDALRHAPHLFHAPAAMLYHWNMIEPHDKKIHRESMLMPLVFTSYKKLFTIIKVFLRRFEMDGGFKKLSKTN